MKNADRERIGKALLGNIPKALAGEARAALEAVVNLDLNVIEPIVDDLVLQAIRSTHIHGGMVYADRWWICNCGMRVAPGIKEYHRHVEESITKPN